MSKTTLKRADRSGSLPVPLWIARKRDGLALDAGTIESLIDGISSGKIPDYQTAALLMAIVWRGLSPVELMAWTRAMIASGDSLDLSAVLGPKVDKHSTGGVGDKVSVVLAPLIAAAGVGAPMIAGRALGHTGGTIDKLEAIAGYNGQQTPRALVRILSKAGFFVAAQTPRLVPADRILYALRDATATVESIALITASIVSKKVAGGAQGLVMDVKTGRGAFMVKRDDAVALGRSIQKVARTLGLPTRVLVTNMDRPLGRQIGNALEVNEAMDLLRGGGPADLRELTLVLGSEMLCLAGAERSLTAARARLQSLLSSGAAFERFLLGMRLHGADLRCLDRPLPSARGQFLVRAKRRGVVADIDARALGVAATHLGAGRLRKEDAVDPGVGITLHAGCGDAIGQGEPLATLWYTAAARLAVARPLVEAAFTLSRGPVASAYPLVLETFR